MNFIKLLFLLFYVGTISLLAQEKNDSIKSHVLSEIEISSNTMPSITRSTSVLQIVNSNNLFQQGVLSVSDALRRFNGIVLKEYGGIGGLKTISIRGMGAEFTTVCYDGVAVSNVQSGQVDIGRFALDNVSTISLNIGQGDDIFQTAKAFSSAGVLNLQTKSPEFKDKRYQGMAKVVGGSFGLFNPSLSYAYKMNDTFTLSANGSWQRADGNYSFKQEDDKLLTDRKRKNSDVDIYRTELNLLSDFGKGGQLNVKAYYFDSERGLPGSVILGNDYAAERLWDKNFFTQISYSNNLSRNFRLKSHLKYDYNKTRYEDVHDKYEGGRLVNKYKEQEFYMSQGLLYLLNEKILFSFAEDLSYNSLDNEIQQFGGNLSYPKRYNSYSALAFQYKSNNLIVTSSLLATYISEKVKNGSGNTIYKKLSPSVGLSYQPIESTNLRIRASFKHVYRVPSFNEVYYSSVEKRLNPESAKQFNVGLTWVGEIAGNASNYISASADGYSNKVDDKIVIIPKTFLATTLNVGNVDIKGLDLRLSANAKLSLKFSLNLALAYSYIQAEDVTDKSKDSYKNQIPYTPKHSGSAILTLNNPWVTFSYSLVASSNRYSLQINDNSSKVAGYSDHSLSLSRQFKLRETELSVQGGITNIWNTNYEVIAYYPMPGRSINFSVGYKF